MTTPFRKERRACGTTPQERSNHKKHARSEQKSLDYRNAGLADRQSRFTVEVPLRDGMMHEHLHCHVGKPSGKTDAMKTACRFVRIEQ
jgi:hypothetical protein